jgi:hypothetical protein
MKTNLRTCAFGLLIIFATLLILFLAFILATMNITPADAAWPLPTITCTPTVAPTATATPAPEYRQFFPKLLHECDPALPCEWLPMIDP